MGNAGGVFQSDEVCVFSIALASSYSGAFSRGSVTQAAVWPFFVVLLSPIGDLDASIERVPEPAHSQTPFPEPSVKALHVRVLGRLAGLDVAQLDVPLRTPGQDVPTGQFGAVVAVNPQRLATPCNHVIEYTCHPVAGKAGVYLQSQALARERVDHAENANHPSGGDHIVGKIKSPLLVSRSRLAERQTAAHAVLALLPTQAQARFAIDPVQPLVVHSLSVALLSACNLR